ncbi:DNA alkylation repair protein [Lacinutrix sp. MedPE-SW]|uniref:DNA alkylation repair protein n=1 Tax=Lacinutrix sp. MedPE-SW TaxID=1860087 RepID=UPI000922E63C|nr:DNA alkylation repair protein [Lacinutrix sp. MedPE-SW]OIQ18791.1 MAG: DNA alkylation repair protein [Lacinutrix sp. MedPE-SW]
MLDFISVLEAEFEKNSNLELAIKQEAYMRNQFKTFGIKTENRRRIQKPFLVKAYLPKQENLETIVKTLWSKPQREFQYFGQELAFKYLKNIQEKDIALYEFMVSNKSWWDTVDFIAIKLIGNYFKVYPELQKQYIDKWLKSNNMWLQRSALLFQLKYKKDLNPELMAYTISQLLGSKTFFINKAIGWILREYSRTNPEWVLNFTKETVLSNLSKKEALRLIN